MDDTIGARPEKADTILRYVCSVAGLAALVRVGGFVEKQCLAGFFGTGSALDAYTVGLQVPMMALFTVAAQLERLTQFYEELTP